jgi:hypothetical protein
MIKKKVAIVIVNWNGKHLLKNCLDSVFAQTYRNFDVYLVDNGSEDGSSSFIRTNYPRVRLIELSENAGFARGNNIGIKEALKDSELEYVVCLNNDTIVFKDWLLELTKTAQSDKSIGAVSSKAYFDDGKTIQNAGLVFYRTLHVNKNGGISLGFGLTDAETPELSVDKEIFAPGGVAPLYKKEVVNKIFESEGEFFDEDFFAYGEDYDLGFRIRKLGYISFLSANAKLIHLHSKTGGVASPFKAFYCERNAFFVAVKNLPAKDVFLFPFRNLYLKLSYFKEKNESVEKLKKQIGFIQMFIILIKAHFFAIIFIPKMFKKRWKLKKIKK